MKLRQMAPWVGVSGATLRRRARSLGYQLDLKDELDVGLAGKLYRELPVQRIMTISYKNPRQPEIEFIGPWNINDWQRLFKKIQQKIMLRQREFIKAARKAPPEPTEQDQPASTVDAVILDTATDNSTEPTTSLVEFVSPDAEIKVLQEHDDARKPVEHTGQCPEAAGCGADSADTDGQPASRPEPAIAG